MKRIYHLKTVLCAGVLLTACGGDFANASYDGLLPMTEIVSSKYMRNAPGNNVYLNPDTGEFAFGHAEFHTADFFSCGLAYIVDANNGKDAPRSGFIDKDNRLVIECRRDEWKSISGFSEGLAIGQTYGSEYVVFDTKGEKVFSLPSDEWTPLTLYKDGCSIWSRQDNGFEIGTWAVIDKKGNIRTFSEYAPASHIYEYNYPSHGLLCVWEKKSGFSSGYKYGAIDIRSGKLAIPCKFTEAFMFDRNGYAVVLDPETEKYGLIDRKGAYTIPPHYTSIETDGPDLYKCESDDLCEWNNHKGKTIVQGSAVHKEIYFFSGRPQFVKIDYDTNGHCTGYYLYHRNHYMGDDIYAMATGEDSREFLSYPLALANGNNIGFYQAAAYDHRCMLLDKNFERVGNHEFHINSPSPMRVPEELKRLQLFYTHGVPYVMNDL